MQKWWRRRGRGATNFYYDLHKSSCRRCCSSASVCGMKLTSTSIVRLGKESDRRASEEWRALTGGRRVRMNVETLGHFGIGVAGDHPFGIVELVPMRIRCLNVHEKDVLGLRIETRYFHFESGKDASKRERKSWSRHTSLREDLSTVHFS